MISFINNIIVSYNDCHVFVDGNKRGNLRSRMLTIAAAVGVGMAAVAGECKI